MALTDSTWYCNAGDQSTTGHYAIAKRPQNTAVAAGQLVRQFTAPSVGNERVFVCIVAGTTANTTDATWTLTRGAKSTDGTATWQEVTGQPSLNGDLTNTATWAQVKAATPAVLGQVIKRSSNASYQICTTAGAMSVSEPSFSDTAGVTTTDTTAVWTSLGPVANFTGGQAPHARLANVFGTNWFASGNTVYVGDNHAETQGTVINIGAASALMARIMCHNHSGSYPPASGDMMVGASVTSTGGNNINITSAGSFYFYGISFVVGGNASLAIGSSLVNQIQNWYYFDNCSFQIANAASPLWMGTGTAWDITIFNNCTVKFLATGCYIFPYFTQFIWQNTGQILASGSSIPTALIQIGTSSGRFNNVTLRNLDLSQLTGSLFTNASNSSIGTLVVQDCKLNAAMTVTVPINSGMNMQLIRSDSAATAYKSTRYQYEGTETTETSIVRTGGAVDPTGQAQSRKIVTSANVQWLRPFKAEPYAIYNSTVGSAVTVTVCGTVNAGALPNNDEIWAEFEYLGDTGVAAYPTTWDLANKSSNITLSLGDLKATATNVNAGVKSKQGKSSGKFYWEITVNVWANLGSWVGLATSATPVSAAGTSAAFMDGGGFVTINGAGVGSSLGTRASGNIIGIAVDLDAELIWFRVAPSGNWNASGTANPATGVGGHSFSALTGPYFPMYAAADVSEAATANFGASAFSGTVPSGFTSTWEVDAVGIRPKGTIVTTTKSSVLASSAAVASDSSTWTWSASTFDPATVSANVTLSNGNRTATHTSATANEGARAGTLLNSGKYYFEFKVVAGLMFLGLGVPAATYANMASGANANVIIYSSSSGNVNIFGGFAGNIGTPSANSIISFAIDLAAGLLWVRRDAGNWNNSGTANPATATGGFAFTAGTTLAPMMALASNNGETVIINCGSAAYDQSVPSGFGDWAGITRFKLAATFTPQIAGWIYARVRAAKISTTYYIDPKITLT